MIYRRDTPATLKAASERLARMNRDPVFARKAAIGRKRSRPAKVKQPAKPRWLVPEEYRKPYTEMRNLMGAARAHVWLDEQIEHDQRKAA